MLLVNLHVAARYAAEPLRAAEHRPTGRRQLASMTVNVGVGLHRRRGLSSSAHESDDVGIVGLVLPIPRRAPGYAVSLGRISAVHVAVVVVVWAFAVPLVHGSVVMPGRHLNVNVLTLAAGAGSSIRMTHVDVVEVQDSPSSCGIRPYRICVHCAGNLPVF